MLEALKAGSYVFSIGGALLGVVIWLVRLEQSSKRNTEKIEDIENDAKDLEKRVRTAEVNSAGVAEQLTSIHKAISEIKTIMLSMMKDK